MLVIIAELRRLALSFWIWWSGELIRFVTLIGGHWQLSSSLLIYIDHDGWTISNHAKLEKWQPTHLSNNKIEDELEILKRSHKVLERSSIVIRLCQHLGLQRTVSLPAIAKAHLSQLLQFELDRLTPFRAEEVYWTHRIIENNETKQQIKVELAAIPKETIDEVCSIAEHHGLRVKRIELDGIKVFDFSYDVLGKANRPYLRRWLPSTAIIASLALFAISYHKILDQETELRELNVEISSMRDEVEIYSRQRKRYEQVLGRQAFLSKSKLDKLTKTEILAELTRLLPDQAYLIQLTIDGNSVQMHGFADRASLLITVLEQSPIFSEPQFRSPVTMDNKTGRERFHLLVQAEPRLQ